MRKVVILGVLVASLLSLILLLIALISLIVLIASPRKVWMVPPSRIVSIAEGILLLWICVTNIVGMFLICKR